MQIFNEKLLLGIFLSITRKTSTNIKLNFWKEAWAHHRMRTAKSFPIALWVSGQYERIVGMEMTNLEEYGVVGFGEDTDMYAIDYN
jgi:hypothetical protein